MPESVEGRLSTLEAQQGEFDRKLGTMITTQHNQHEENRVTLQKQDGRLQEIETLLRIKDAERRFMEKLGSLIAKIVIGVSSGSAGWFLRDWQGPHHP